MEQLISQYYKSHVVIVILKWCVNLFVYFLVLIVNTRCSVTFKLIFIIFMIFIKFFSNDIVMLGGIISLDILFSV